MAKEKQLKITLEKSLIGRSEAQKKVVESLGLNKIGKSVIKNDTPQIRGMINKIDFMLKVEEI